MTIDREYFESDNQTIGYRMEGYRDFATHHKLAEFILGRNPESVLELGGARGYIAKILQNHGISVTVMDKSEHCYNTRAIDEFCLWDIENTPYPFKDKEFDLVYSSSVLEHISPDKLDSAIREIGRIGKRSYHNVVPMSDKVPKSVFDEDDTHKIYESQQWWLDKFGEFAPGHRVEVYWDNPDGKHVSVPGWDGGLTKLNIGCGFNMIYYGWVNIDGDHGYVEFALYNSYKYLDTNSSTLIPLGNGVVDLIYIPNGIGALPIEPTNDLLSECHRVLKPGGLIRVVVIDARKIFTGYANHTSTGIQHIIHGIDSSKTTLEDIAKLYDGHHTFWDGEILEPYLMKFGFKEISKVSPFGSRSKIMEQQTIVKYPDISLVMEATK